MKLIPIEDRIVGKIASKEENIIGGIIIPDTAKEKPQMANVISVGNDEALNTLVSIGDTVLYRKFAGTQIEIDGEKLIVLSKADILAIVED